MAGHNPSSPPSPKSLLAGVKAVSFDAGFTLFEPHPSVGDVYALVGKRFGIESEPDALTARFFEVWKKRIAEERCKNEDFFSDEERSRQWWYNIVRDTFRHLTRDEQRLEALAEACFMEYGTGAWWRVFPEVRPLLEALRQQGYRLAVLSNWDKRLEQTLRDLELDHFFDVVCISTLLGVSKPRPEAYAKLAGALDLPAKDILHIGDAPEEDYYGPQRVGMQSLLVARGHKKIPSDIPDTAICDSLQCLMAERRSV